MKIKKGLLSITLIAGMILSSSVSFAVPVDAEKEEKIFLNRVSKERAMDYIGVLSEDIGVRIAGTDKEYEAALDIADKFEKLGYDTEIQEFKYNSGSATSWNVVATMKPWTNGNKTDANDTNEIVYVTAHYDSVPKAPGANDNASGTSAILEIAKSMHNMDIDKEVRFIACGAEEVGLKGSQAYVNSLTEDEKSRSLGNFNLDMVATAYEPCSELAVYTNKGNENIVTDAMKEAGERLKHLSTETVEYNGEFDGKMNSSDHVPFDNAGIASALFINVDPAKKDNPRSAIEPYYHKPEDHTGNVSIDRLERTIKLVGIAVLDTLNVD